ncbi:MAG: hypothetical protein GWP19_00485 [Planctomycetia bacterium]|nr:hypothetical protein [Planctomycetia bacterium]
MLLIDPINFGLSPRTLLGQLSKKHIVIIKDRKSRIIMKDGNKILEQINLIQDNEQKVKISLATNAPVCSKTTVFLRENGIEIIALEKQR